MIKSQINFLNHFIIKIYKYTHTCYRGDAGTGLGSSIVEHIIQMHNGKIKVDGMVNKGTIFAIIFSK